MYPQAAIIKNDETMGMENLAYLWALLKRASVIDCGKRYRMGKIAALVANVATKSVFGFELLRPPL